jgi:hypothetical protein
MYGAHAGMDREGIYRLARPSVNLPAEAQSYAGSHD